MSLFPSAMWDENSRYPKIETGCAFTDDMKDKKNLIERLLLKVALFYKYCIKIHRI